jgi:3-oxoacyl-[acyl-carrier protein] reductase
MEGMMDLGIQGRVAMIAAASKGLGRASAQALAAEGCQVSICARDDAKLVQTRREIESLAPVLAMRVDVSKREELERWYEQTVERFGQVDILVTNTGGPPVARFLDLSDEQWQSGVDSTLMNVVRLTRMVVPGMQVRKWGRIIHLTSLVAKQPLDELTVSSTLRAGLSGLTKTMANQFGPDGITVNAVLMGHILTDRQEQLIEYRTKERGITREQYLEEIASNIPLKRIGDPLELGKVVAFLASECASYVTGVSLPVDGGVIRASL